MGTRHLICVFFQGKWVVAQYGQWDGYPEGQGVKIYRFLSVARNIDNLKAGLAHLYIPTDAEMENINREIREWEASRMMGDPSIDPRESRISPYPSLSRDTSAKLLGMIANLADDNTKTEEEGQTETGVDEEDAATIRKAKKPLPIIMDLEFSNDTLFCEWAYVIDLDTEVLEVYGGGEKKREGHRFKDVGPQDAPVPKFGCSIPFRELYLMSTEDEFMERIQKGFPPPGSSGEDAVAGEESNAAEDD